MSAPDHSDRLRIEIGYDLPDETRTIVQRSVAEMLHEMRPATVETSAGLTSAGPGPAELVAEIGAIGSGVATLKIIAEAVIAWRRKLEKNKVQTSIRIVRRGKHPINFNIATDEEITIYITDGAKDS